MRLLLRKPSCWNAASFRSPKSGAAGLNWLRDFALCWLKPENDIADEINDALRR